MSLPTPYYSKGGITIFCADCRTILPHLPPVDLVLTDPPYGISYVQGGGNGAARQSRFCGVPVVGDDEPFDPAPFIQMAPAILWGANYYSSSLPNGRWLVWDKRCGVTPPRDQADCEMAWASSGSACRVFRHVWDGMIRDSERGPRQHPTQKPVQLMKWCIEQAGDEAQTILDPFMGSGTTLVAARDLGRRAIGIESEEPYCEIAVRRLSQQLLPFGGES